MRIRLLFVTLSLLLAVGIQAGRRTKDEVKTAALGVLLQNSAPRTAVAASSATHLKEYLAGEHLSVVGHDDLGFAVVTSDARFPSVIGYSFSPFTDSMPDGFKWWLKQAEATMRDAGMPENRRRTSAGSREAIAPLLTTQWGQETPYNAQLRFVIDGSVREFQTGCVATAMAQVMKYHRFPSRGYGSVRYLLHNYNTVMAHTFGSTYDWDLMADSYPYAYGPVSTSAKAVSELMRDCGMAVEMNYGPQVSTSNSALIANALTKYFCYDEGGTKQLLRSDYDADAWMQTIYDELSAGRPIIYSGIDRSDADRPNGHTFVVHGCDDAGLCYINWGWRGNYDGYFNLDMLHPGQHAYDADQDMVIARPGAEPVFLNFSLSASGPGSALASMLGFEVRNSSTAATVRQGSAVALTFFPDGGNRVTSLTVDGNDVTPSLNDNTYIIDAVNQDAVVSVTFGPIVYSLGIAAEGGGAVSYSDAVVRNSSGTFTLQRGSSATFSVLPDEGWTLSRLTVNGADVTSQVRNNSYTVASMVADVSVVAQFARRSYQLSYLLDSAPYASYTVEFGAPLPAEAEPQREGYTFSGWSPAPALMPAADVTLTGTFTVKAYRLTFTIDGEVFMTDLVDYRSPIQPPVVPLPEGYDFAWGDYPSLMPAADVTVAGFYTVNVSVSDASVAPVVHISPQCVSVSGLQPAELVSLYSLSGRKLVSAQAAANGVLQLSTTTLPAGLYILKAGSRSWTFPCGLRF